MTEGTGQRGGPAACTFFDLDALLEAEWKKSKGYA